MDFIVEFYKVERAALHDDLLGTDAHLAMRQSRSRQVGLISERTFRDPHEHSDSPREPIESP
jgi:hypothetical protein